MTFDAAAHPRATNGQFSEKLGGMPEVGLIATVDVSHNSTSFFIDAPDGTSVQFDHDGDFDPYTGVHAEFDAAESEISLRWANKSGDGYEVHNAYLDAETGEEVEREEPTFFADWNEANDAVENGF